MRLMPSHDKFKKIIGRISLIEVIKPPCATLIGESGSWMVTIGRTRFSPMKAPRLNASSSVPLVVVLSG